MNEQLIMIAEKYDSKTTCELFKLINSIKKEMVI